MPLDTAPDAIYSQVMEESLILYCLFFTSVIITSISGFFPWIEDQWKGLYLYLFILAKGIFRSLHLENGKHSSVRESVSEE